MLFFQCSRTCGSGVRSRSVRCYENAELSDNCDESIRPESTMKCRNPPCPVQSGMCVPRIHSQIHDFEVEDVVRPACVHSVSLQSI